MAPAWRKVVNPAQAKVAVPLPVAGPGGAVIFHDAGITPQVTATTVTLGLEQMAVIGVGRYAGAGLPETEHVMYQCALAVEAGDDVTVLARATLPYFNRDWRHYCPHRHAPSEQVMRWASPPAWLKAPRPPLGLIHEQGNEYTLYFTAFDGLNPAGFVEPWWHDGFGDVGLARMRVE